MNTFAQEVVEECASFPFGDHDDYVDSTTQAIMRIKQGGLVRNQRFISKTNRYQIEVG